MPKEHFTNLRVAAHERNPSGPQTALDSATGSYAILVICPWLASRDKVPR